MRWSAVLAGGCFWGMQDLIRRQPGVISTRVGYTGGKVRNATYRNHEGRPERRNAPRPRARFDEGGKALSPVRAECQAALFGGNFAGGRPFENNSRRN